MNTWLFVCVFCLALTPLLAFAHIQNTAHRQTANRSGPLLPGLCCAPGVCLSLSSLRYRHAAKIATPIRVHASMGLGCNVEKIRNLTLNRYPCVEKSKTSRHYWPSLIPRTQHIARPQNVPDRSCPGLCCAPVVCLSPSSLRYRLCRLPSLFQPYSCPYWCFKYP